MALNKTALKDNIIVIMQEMMTREETSIEEFAERLSTALDEYIKQADIKYISGLATPSGGGAVTGTFQGNLE